MQYSGIGCQSNSSLWGNGVDEHVVKSHQQDSSILAYDCNSAEEFKTTFTFLKSEKGLQLDEQKIRSIALEVAGGCNGAAGRFVLIVEMLLKAKLDGKDAILIGRQYALESNAAAKSFAKIFKAAFPASKLDLDLPKSIALAQEFTQGRKVDPERMAQEFAVMTKFCLKQSGLDLSKPICAALTERVLKNSPVLSGEDPLLAGESFVETFNFLTTSDGPNLTTRDSVILAEELVQISPYTYENFRDAYNFAIKGLKLDRVQAIGFAKKIATQTVSEIQAPQNTK